MAISLVTLLNTLDFHFLQPLPCLSVDDRERIVIESLCKKLRFLQAFLEDSPDNSINCPAWRGLETEIRYVAGEAESKIELELYQLYNEEEAPVEPCESLHQTLQQVTGDIESLQRRIQHIENYRNRSHSVEPPTRNPAIQNIKADSSSKRSTDQPENEMVGCDDEFETIKRKLISDSENLEVISITGMGGIGKTTLAQRVYNDEAVHSYFDILEWTTVSQQHNIREMLCGLLGSNDTNQDVYYLASQLRKKLLGQRYLIVIDDIWSTQAWDDIHRCFSEDFNGSRILLTTRLKQVADYVSSAEGFLKLELNKSMEEVAYDYLQDLVDRGLVQIDKWSHTGNKIKYCKLHDVLHSFSLREAQRENLLGVINESNNVHELGVGLAASSLDRKASRWVVSRSSNSVIHPYSKLLRVLSIRQHTLNHLPKEIVDLVHLRYLALKIGLESIYTIDYQWRKLRCLQTIIIDSPCDFFSPNNILDMPQIRHVYFSTGSLEYLDLPKLVQENLQTLSWLSQPQRLQTEPDFKGIPNMKELGIYLTMSYDDADEIPSLSEETWDLLPPISMEGLLNLHQLENLKFRCNLKKCDRKLLKAIPPNLKKLTLEGTEFSWEDIAIINTLPNLEVLKLRYDAFCGPEWKATGNGFCKLKYLEVNGLSSLKHWSVDADHFPILESIYLRYCLHLVEFPTGFGDINTLQLIHLKSCPSSLVTSAKIFQEERRDLGDDKLVLREFYTLPKEFIYEDAFA